MDASAHELSWGFELVQSRYGLVTAIPPATSLKLPIQLWRISLVSETVTFTQPAQLSVRRRLTAALRAALTGCGRAGETGFSTPIIAAVLARIGAWCADEGTPEFCCRSC